MEIPNAGMFTVNEYDWTRPAEETLPGGGRRHYAYDSLMRVTDIDVDDPGANAQLHYGYTYDRVDNVRTRQSAAGETVYGYDDLYRLTGVDDPDGQDEAFTYDHVGNRKTAADTAGEWAYNDNNELEGYDDVTFQYDANGNMTEKNAGGVITQFFYNLEDRLERVEDGAGNTIATYYYDPFGRRLWKEVAGTRTYFHYSGEGLVGEYDATGAEIKGYGWKPGGTWSTDPLFMRVGGEYYWYHNDHLGTPQMMTTSSGAVVWKAKYSSFGNATVDSASTVVNPLRFPGQYEDQETGLHYNWFRYYNPDLGRYLRHDPIGFWGGENFFTYVANNSINFGDPYGLFELPPGPSGLGPQWTVDPKHFNPKDPTQVRYRDPSGRPLDWHPKKPGADPKTWAGKDHWHDPNNFGNKHLPPGTEVPDPKPPKVPNVSPKIRGPLIIFIDFWYLCSRAPNDPTCREFCQLWGGCGCPGI